MFRLGLFHPRTEIAESRIASQDRFLKTQFKESHRKVAKHTGKPNV